MSTWDNQSDPVVGYFGSIFRIMEYIFGSISGNELVSKGLCIFLS